MNGKRLRLRTFLSFSALSAASSFLPPRVPAELCSSFVRDLGPGLRVSFSSLYRAGHIACIQDGAPAALHIVFAQLRGARRSP